MSSSMLVLKFVTVRSWRKPAARSILQGQAMLDEERTLIEFRNSIEDLQYVVGHGLVHHLEVHVANFFFEPLLVQPAARAPLSIPARPVGGPRTAGARAGVDAIALIGHRGCSL